MATAVKVAGQVLLCLCVFYGLSGEVSARGRGGGGGRGGGRGGSRGVSRGGASRGVSRGGGRRFGGVSWKTAAVGGVIFGYASYSHRRRYISNRNSEPTICTNRYDYRMGNGTAFAYFICPMADQGEDFTYCCGPSDRQKCCRFGDSPGRVAGVVIGVLIFVAIIGGCVYCCCCRNRDKPFKGATLSKPTVIQSPGAAPARVAGYRPVPGRDVHPTPMQFNPSTLPEYQPVPATGPTATYPQTGPTYPSAPANFAPQPGYQIQPGGGPEYPPQAGYPSPAGEGPHYPLNPLSNDKAAQPPFPESSAPPMDGIAPYPPGPAPAYQAPPYPPAGFNIPPDNQYPPVAPPPYPQ